MRPRDVAVFTRQMATLLHAGIPLAEAMSALSEQSDNKKFQMILAGIKQKVNEGGSFADAMVAHPKVFPDLYTNMVRSGETAGNLDAVLVRLADFMDAQIELRSKVSGAMAYPILMTIVGSLVLGFLMTVVVPPIAGIFADSGKALPWNTQLLVFVADVAGRLLVAGAPGAGRRLPALPALVAKAQGARCHGSPQAARLARRPLIRFIAVARFARTLATMLASGVPVLTALEIVKRVLNNTVLEKVVEEARVAIREGESIAATLKKSGQFPVDDVPHGRGRRAFGPARSHARERRGRLRARRGDRGRQADLDPRPADDRHHGASAWVSSCFRFSCPSSRWARWLTDD